MGIKDLELWVCGDETLRVVGLWVACLIVSNAILFNCEAVLYDSVGSGICTIK